MPEHPAGNRPKDPGPAFIMVQPGTRIDDGEEQFALRRKGGKEFAAQWWSHGDEFPQDADRVDEVEFPRGEVNLLNIGTLQLDLFRIDRLRPHGRPRLGQHVRRGIDPQKALHISQAMEETARATADIQYRDGRSNERVIPSSTSAKCRRAPVPIVTSSDCLYPFASSSPH